jgi:hypothetical protein
MAGLATSKRGYVWRVGNGEKINIWQDPWIPSSQNKKVITPRGALVFIKVSNLIDPITKQGDVDILQSLLHPVDVQRILQIPLHNRGFDDFITWSLTKHGRYTSDRDITHNGGINLVRREGNSPWLISVEPYLDIICGILKYLAIYIKLYGEHRMGFFPLNVLWQIDTSEAQVNVLYVSRVRKISSFGVPMPSGAEDVDGAWRT